MPVGVIQEISRTAKGAPFAVIDGVRYYTSKCETQAPMALGLRVEYVSEPFGTAGRDGKHPQGLVKWRPILDAAGTPEKASTVSELNILQSVSNVVGSACAAGTVKTPEELEKWFVAAFRGFARMSAQAESPESPESPEQPDFDDSAELEQLASAAAAKQHSSW